MLIRSIAQGLPQDKRDILEPLLTILAQRQPEIAKFENCRLIDGDLEAILARNEEPKSLQVTLSALADAKIALLDEPLSLKQVTLLMRLLNRDDEPLLHDLLKEKVFDVGNCLGLSKAVSGHEALTLLNFYLGYCTSEEQLA